jgi:hypothetical protein
MSTLGRLEPVPLREIWASESSDFTPWLAREDNLQLLGKTIGIELALEAQEQKVGLFRADILCKDTGTNHWVLVENQVEPTDHCHLGQLLTYAAGLEAATIVWVAARIREEHRAALDWLNEVTGERFNFFGLEIELWRIGDSPVAPKFNVVCKPNDWSNAVRGRADDIDRGGGSVTAQTYLEYWTAFRAYLQESGSFIRSQKPWPQFWADHAIGRSWFNATALASISEKNVAAAIIMRGRSAKQYYRALLAHKEALEREVGEPLSWEERPEGVESRVSIYLRNADPADRADWPRQHAWLREKLEKLHRAFAPRIKNLNIGETSEASSQSLAETQPIA